MYEQKKQELATSLEGVAGSFNPQSPIAVDLRTMIEAINAMPDEVLVAHLSEDCCTDTAPVVSEVPAAPAEVVMEDIGKDPTPYMGEKDPEWNEVATRTVMAAALQFKYTTFNPNSDASDAPKAPMPKQNFDTGIANGVKDFKESDDASDAPAAPMPEQNFDSKIDSSVKTFDPKSESSDAPAAPMPKENFETGLEKGVKEFKESDDASDAPAAPMPGQNFESGLVQKSNTPVKTAADAHDNNRTDGEEITQEVYEAPGETPVVDSTSEEAPATEEEVSSETPAEDLAITDDSTADTTGEEVPAVPQEGEEAPAAPQEGEGQFFGGDEDEASLGLGDNSSSTAPAEDGDLDISFEDEDEGVESHEAPMSDTDFSFDTSEESEEDEDAIKTANIQRLVNEIFGRK